ncbi:MAG TPA: hypothetical protein DDY29_10865 [Rhodobacteraceae bacterium]|jgi:hypothetical protein|nr:PH domain-containing protein [Paracoccaceae bacterium]HBG99188.1 hypothetical protein [Paracoccaceae bacterium]
MPHDDFAFEPVRGLPAPLPEGEHILWQGAPDWRALAREALLTRWIAGWFVLLALWRGLAAGEGVMGVLGAGVPLLLLGAAAVVILWGVAWVMARAAVYTLTNRRVVMRIGAALQVTFNLPFKQIETASLDLRKGGTGTIALRLTEGSKIAYLVAWPHVRPWHMARTEPALRCIPDARRVAALIAETAESQLAQPVLSRDGGDAAAKLAAE